MFQHHRDIQLYDHNKYCHPKPKSCGSSNIVNSILQNPFLIHVSFRMRGFKGMLIVITIQLGAPQNVPMVYSKVTSMQSLWMLSDKVIKVPFTWYIRCVTS